MTAGEWSWRPNWLVHWGAVHPTTGELDTASFERAARAFPILHRVLAKLLSERLRRTSERVGDTARGS